MRLCLSTAATATDFEIAVDASGDFVQEVSKTPNLGILTLAAVAREFGILPTIVNLNSRYYGYLASGGAGVREFAEFAATHLAAFEADVYGFGSICSSYPLTIRIAAALKRARPESLILCGGPQASAADLETLAAFPFIDLVLRGEADETLPILLEEIAGSRRYERVPGLTHRSPFGPVGNGSAPVVRDLDHLPTPAFDLTGELVGASSAPIEIGRGCPFSCTFCSTNDFFRRKFRLRSPERVLSDMRAIHAQYGIRHFELTHDMFTVDRRKVMEFCDCMIRCGEKFRWNCSARTDSVDQELLEHMAEAGCQGVFFGIETGSQRMQRVIDKDLDIPRAREIVSLADRLGIETAVSLIAGFPEETWTDVRQTLDMYAWSLRHPLSNPQLNILAPLSNTPIQTKHREQLFLDELCSDLSHQGQIQNSADRELIRKYPNIFPNFYLLPVPFLDRDCLSELHEFCLTVAPRLRWLVIALDRSGNDLLDAFLAWRRHRMKSHPGLRGWSLRQYYLRGRVPEEFVRFASNHLAKTNDPAVACLLTYYEALAAAKRNQPQHPDSPELAEFDAGDMPVRASHVYVFELDFDLEAVKRSLTSGSALQLADRSRRLFRTAMAGGNELRILETRPLIAAALAACDGKSTIRDVRRQLAAHFDGPVSSRRLAADCVIETLREQNLIRIYANVAKPVNSAHFQTTGRDGAIDHPRPT